MTTHDNILALVKGGHMARLAGNPLAVLLVYVAHADAEGTAWPSLETICKLSGIAAPNHVCTARKALLDSGLLELVCRTKLSTKYRVRLGGEPAASVAGEGQASTETGQSEKRTVQKADSPGNGHKTVRKTDNQQSEKRPEKQSRNQKTFPTETGGDAAGAAAATLDAPDEPSPDQRRHAAAAVAPTSVPYRGKKLTESQNATRLAFRAWWCTEAFPQRMEGVVYTPESADFSAELRLLRCSFVAWDLDRARAVALTYLEAPDVYLANHGRPLSLLGRQIHNWAAQTKRRLDGKGATHVHKSRPDAAARGEYAQPKRDLPSLRRAASGTTAGGTAVARAG